MACSLQIFILFLSFLMINGTVSHNPSLPRAAVIPVIKDSSTLQYVTQLFMGENTVSVKAVLDLGGPFLWLDCHHLSSNLLIASRSLQCSMAESSCSGCARESGNLISKTCTVQSRNGISKVSSSGDLVEDRLVLKLWDAVNSDSVASIDRFLFSCAPTSLLSGLANGARGMLGLGDSRISISSQFSTEFGFFDRKFSICLSPSAGAIFLGGKSPYENWNSMTYTPLISNKNSGYYVNVSSIKIYGKKLSLNQPKEFNGGTRISTTIPYTTMGSKIYRKFVQAFINSATSMNLTVAAAVAPFKVCFASKEEVPVIDLVLQSEVVKWRIDGRNSMVRMSDEVMCLGFMEGGLDERDSIVIGGLQLEEYMVEFNLGISMLGFSSSKPHKKCSDSHWLQRFPQLSLTSMNF